MDIRFGAAVVFVKDIPASRRFYEDLLGQKVVMDHGPNVVFAGGWAVWQAEHANGLVYGEAARDDAPLGRQNLELYFECETVDEAWDMLQKAGVSVVHPIREQPWGQRVFRVHDPDGHVVEIGEPITATVTRYSRSGMTADEVARRTSMPLDNVKQIIAAAG